MIELPDIATKLQTILNSATGFEQYQFVVETHGFHLDKISDTKTGRNFIPVFISTMGGQHNPVPNLKQTELNVPITFYYPVRFKDDFFNLNDYLITTFVGKFITFGSQKARCNISIPQYGEIQDLDLKEFKQWVGSLYHKEIEVMEPYLSMTINLYLSTCDGAFIYGDDIKISNIKINYNGTKILDDSSPIIIERADIANSENASQQSFDDTFIKGYPANLGFTKELPLMIKNNAEYRALLSAIEYDKNCQKLRVSITEKLPFDTELTITTDYYVSNYSRKTSYGSLFGISLTLTPARG